MAYTNKKWLFIYPHVFIFNKHDRSLLYNSESGDCLFCETNNEILELCEPQNMYSILIEESIIMKFIVFKQIIDKGFGILIPYDETNIKPISIYPSCLIDTRIIQEASNYDYNSCLYELKDITIMLTGECPLNCEGCGDYYRQRLWCHKQKSVIKFERIKKFLSFLSSSRVAQINLIGGDIFLYPEIDNVLLLLGQYNIKKRIIIYYSLLMDHIDKLLLLSDQGYILELLIDSSFDENTLINIIVQLALYNVNFVMSVCSVEDYENASSFANDNNIDIDIVPIFNGENLSFFEDNVFDDYDDIRNSAPIMKEVFAHQMINNNRFGKLFIFSDGKIFANVNKRNIGSIDDNIYTIIRSQLKEGSDWRDIRVNNICSDCLFQWLCPSPSDYNFVLDKPNLCHYFPKK